MLFCLHPHKPWIDINGIFFSWFSVLDQIASNSCKILALAIRQVEMKKSADYEQSNVGRAFPRLSVLICTLWVVIGINSWVSFSQGITV